MRVYLEQLVWRLGWVGILQNTETRSTAPSTVQMLSIDVERKTPASHRHVHPALISKL